MNPNQAVAVGNLADAYRWSGQPEKASASYARAIALACKDLEVNPRDAGAMSNLALYYAKSSESSRALDFIRRARSIDADNVDFLYTEAVVRAIAGQKREAVEALSQALEKGYAIADVASNPEFATLQEIPEFKALLERFEQASPAPKQ
jgi:serine/threonine-protein kinase